MLAVFSLVYDVYYAWHYNAHFSLKEALRNLPQTEATNALWYLYLYLGLLLMLPLLQKLVKALITVTATAACVYVCVKYLSTAHPAPEVAERGVCALGALTFGIYLFGDMVINYTERIYSALAGHMHALCAMALWDVLIFTLCALVTALLRLIPPLRRWV